MIAGFCTYIIWSTFFRSNCAARVGLLDSYVLNPSIEDMDNLRDNSKQRLDLVVRGQDAVMMVESVYELSEKMLGAVKFGHEQMQKVIELIISLAEKTANEPYNFVPSDNKELVNKIKSLGEKDIKAFSIADKQERQNSLNDVNKMY